MGGWGVLWALLYDSTIYLADPEADLTDVEGVVVATDALLPEVRVDEVWILPGAREAAVVEENVALERMMS